LALASKYLSFPKLKFSHLFKILKLLLPYEKFSISFEGEKYNYKINKRASSPPWSPQFSHRRSIKLFKISLN